MLQSITLRFDPVEDRVLMRLAQEPPTEHELWLALTRRVCSLLRRDLQALAAQSAQAPLRMAEAARAAVTAMHHQALADQVPARSEPRAQPGPTVVPSLVVGVATGRNKADGRWVLRFDLRAQPAVQVALTDQTLHAVIRLLNQQVSAAGWGLEPMAVEAAPGEGDLTLSSRGYH
jgi:hypothetical protein